MDTVINKLTQDNFNPIKLELTFQTLDELTAFYAILCHNSVHILLQDSGINVEKLRQDIQDSQVQHLPYHEQFSTFRKMLKGE